METKRKLSKDSEHLAVRQPKAGKWVNFEEINSHMHMERCSHAVHACMYTHTSTHTNTQAAITKVLQVFCGVHPTLHFPEFFHQY